MLKLSHFCCLHSLFLILVFEWLGNQSLSEFLENNFAMIIIFNCFIFKCVLFLKLLFRSY